MNATEVFLLLLWLSYWTTRAAALTPEEWQRGSTKCSPCFCSIARPAALGGSMVKHANCTGLYLDEIPGNLPEDTEFLDVSRRAIQDVRSSDAHFNGSSLMYPGLPSGITNTTTRLHKLKYLDLTGNSFSEFNSDPFMHLEFLSGIFGLEVHILTVGSFTGFSELVSLELRTPMEIIPDNLFFHLKTSRLTLHLENAKCLPSSIFDPLKTSLKTLIIYADKLVEIPESLLDNLLLLQKFTLNVKELDSIPEHLLHGSTLFRNLNLKQDIPVEILILLHSVSSTRYLKDVTIDGVRQLPKDVFQFIPYLESITVHRAEQLEPDLFKRLVRLNNLNLAENNVSDVKKEWFQDLGGLRTLNLSNNGLGETSSDDFENLHSLEVFDLSRNGLKQVQSSAFDSFRSAIEELYLNENNFSSLQKDVFSEMWSLRELRLDDNNISEVQSSLFRDLNKLETLTLNNNQIDTVEDRSFDGLHELKTLDISDNSIETLPDGLFSSATSLQAVNMSGNRLESVAAGMLNSHFWLKDLDVGTNPLHCDCALARMVDANKQSAIAGKCSSPPQYADTDVGNLPTSTMCTQEELRRQEEQERRRREEERRRRQEEIRRREEELKKTKTTTTTTTTTMPVTTTLNEMTSSDVPETTISVPTKDDSEVESIETKQRTSENENGSGKYQDKVVRDYLDPNNSGTDEQVKTNIKRNEIDDFAVKENNDENGYANDDDTDTNDNRKNGVSVNSRYPDENENTIVNNDYDTNIKSDNALNSQGSRSGNLSRNPWVIAVIVLVCVLVLIGAVLGFVKARGHLYRDNYNFNFTREHIIDPAEESILY